MGLCTRSLRCSRRLPPSSRILLCNYRSSSRCCSHRWRSLHSRRRRPRQTWRPCTRSCPHTSSHCRSPHTPAQCRSHRWTHNLQTSVSITRDDFQSFYLIVMEWQLSNLIVSTLCLWVTLPPAAEVGAAVAEYLRGPGEGVQGIVAPICQVKHQTSQKKV